MRVNRTGLIHITTAPQTLYYFFVGQVSYMKGMGLQVHAIASPGYHLQKFAEAEKVPVHAVEMPRRITPLRDLVAVARLWRHLRRIKPTIVHAHTPKGGLLGMIAARLAGVPVRIYHIHGLPFTTSTGYKRFLMRWTERIACLLAHQVLCVSYSVREVAVREGICPSKKVKVLAHGSVNGVDAEWRFNPASYQEEERANTRCKYGIPDNAIILGFVGRIVRDKGVVELAEAWKVLRERFENLHLLIVGPFEDQDPVPVEVRALLAGDPRIHLVDQVDDPTPFYAIMDILVLPTYREGFPVVPLEAAAMSIPVVATRIPGCVEAVVDGTTGTLVPSRDGIALAQAVETYVEDPDLRSEHGRAGRERMLREFRPEVIWQATYDEYIRLLGNKGRSIPRARDGRE